MEKSAALGPPLSSHKVNGSHKRKDLRIYDCKTVDTPHTLIIIGALRTLQHKFEWIVSRKHLSNHVCDHC